MKNKPCEVVYYIPLEAAYLITSFRSYNDHPTYQAQSVRCRTLDDAPFPF